MPRKMRDSGVAWIGAIPEGWRVVPLKRYAEVGNGQAIAEEVDIGTHGAVPVYGSGGIFKYTNQVLHSGESVLFGRKGTLGKPLFVVGDFWTVDTMYYSTFKGGCLPKFAYYMLSSFDWEPFITRTAVPSMVASEVFASKFALPDTITQGSIASYLDTKCVEIDAAIASARQSIEDYTALKKSLIQEITFAGVSQDVRLKDTRVSWIGELPESWPTIPLKYLLTEVNVRSETGEEEPLSMSQKLGIVPSRMISVANPATSYIGAKIVEKGDLVFNKLKAHLGVFAISEYQGLVSPDYAVYRSQGNVDMRYLVRIFHTPKCIAEFKRYISGIGAGLSRLYTSDLFRIKVPCPPLAEQRVIADILDEKCAAIDALVAEKEALIADLESYKKSLIFEVVTGKREVA